MKIVGGSKGKSFNDRELAGRVRTLGLTELEKALKGKDEEFKKAVLLRIAPALLPRLNEHTGADGVELPVPIFPIVNVQSHDSDQKDNSTQS